jgi:hypothetical protein
MEANDQIVNRVAASALVTFDLESYYTPGERVLLDIKDQLFQGLILREKDFRAFIKDHNWSAYHGKYVAVTCSVDAIIPNWAYMLVAIALEPFARKVVFGDLARLEDELFFEQLRAVDWTKYTGQKVVVKGCSKYEPGPSVYLEVALQLRPLVSSLMFGEPCSTVPLFKSKNGLT